MTTIVWARPIWSSHLGKSPNIFRYCTVNCIITFLLYIQLLKENATFKLHFVLIVLPCKQQNFTYIRFLNDMHLPLKRTSKLRNKTNLWPAVADYRQRMHVASYRIASLLCTCLLHAYISKRWFSYREKSNLDYRCVYAIKNVICVKTGLERCDWRKLRFKMERIRGKRKTTWQLGCDISDSVDHRRKLAGS